jgi:adenylate cyclase
MTESDSSSGPGPGDLERAVLGEAPVFNAEDIASETGVDLDEAQRLWRALGFPEHGMEVAFTVADAEALSPIHGIVESGLIDLDTAVNLTRGVGQTMSRLADWEVATMSQVVDGEDAVDRALLLALEQLGKPFERLLIYSWRRHLAAAVTRVQALRANEEDLNTVQLTVGFADIVSFTALSNRLTEERIGDLVELFESRCLDVVASQHGRVIKSIGDSVLFVNDDPVRAYDTAEGIINVVGRDARMPDVRLGLASGSVVMRLGDVFGPPPPGSPRWPGATG